MTTIAYSAGWLAVDSYGVCNAGSATHKTKVTKARRTTCRRAFIAVSGGILTEEQFNVMAEKLLVEIVRMETTPPPRRAVQTSRFVH
jgi:hypothetical protein